MLKSIHRASGIAISTFFIVHIINHLFALAGADMHIAVMNLLRAVYRFPPVEVFLLMCVGIQIASGLWLLWTKGFSKNAFDVLQALSGLYLSFFLIYHVRAVILARYEWNADTNFHFAAWVVKNYPAAYFFIPYYALSVICVFVHIACAHRQKVVDQFGASNSRATRQAYMIVALGILTTTLIMTGLVTG
jgi:succinate dehydrogenase/fumarate reductase cytochrome b subunit